MQYDMLETLHIGHQGIVETKNRARDILFWNGMGKEPRMRMCDLCKISDCESYGIDDPKWTSFKTVSKIEMDLFELRGNHFLLVVDYLLKWPELAKLESLICVWSLMWKAWFPNIESQTSLLVIMGHRSTVTNSRSLWNRFTSHIPRPVRTMLRVTDRRNEWFWPWNVWSTNHKIHIYRFWSIWAPRLMVLTCLQPSYFGTQTEASILPTTVLLLKSFVDDNRFVKMKCR